MGSFRAGRSIENRDIQGYEIIVSVGRPPPTVLVLGGLHGDEPKSVYLVQKLISELENHRVGKDGQTVSNRRGSMRWIVLPLVNPDGFERRKRRNARKVDLNRNFPTSDWEEGSSRSRMFGGHKAASEPETRAVIRVIERFEPDAIITVHSINRNRQCNNFDGPGKKLARHFSKFNRYPVASTIGYPTPGSFGVWAGVERNIPTLTLELPSHHSSRRCWHDNRRAFLELDI